MPDDELTREGQHVMTVCNACRYCEQFCPVFPAMEERLTFGGTDLTYLANLCHNCGECLYACQYAPPHEFGINVPRTLARIRVRSYEEYCWPRAAGVAFRQGSVLASLGLTGVLIGAVWAATRALNPGAMRQAAGAGEFYAVVSHEVMVVLFGAVFLFVSAAIGTGVLRFWRDAWGNAGPLRIAVAVRGLRDVVTLRHLHGGGVDCPSDEDTRAPWRRWFHHCTFYGFLLCFASTTVAAVYHVAFGWRAPHAYASLPVLLGTVGGVGLLVGPVGLLLLRRRRDPALGDPSQSGMDASFVTMLVLVSGTGLALLGLRTSAVMAPLLMIHLGTVLAFCLTLPYGKFVHGFYRSAALLVSAMETARHDAKSGHSS